ncbi:Hypothetical protein, putative [Bodo saltans]|uniref:Uncharacterized protein n=1 Tax=Bodo saltans TaxID=75058 RepID=A0A0S4KPC1_BODSA|nr:Hypothetical protein, putative [Bodo saltans]|eukprot:CUI15476.1 Hypothetical protein, putative [Bodo saltans]
MQHAVLPPLPPSSKSSVPQSPMTPGGAPVSRTSHSPPIVPLSVVDYVQSHNIHILLDRMVKDILVETPKDSDAWMLRWFLEQHRQSCAQKHMNSQQQHQLQELQGREDHRLNSESPSL